jgi:alginate O-acetyltransferase complex protein AlgI
VNFAGGLAIERARGDVARRRLVCGVVALDVAVLAVWKYAGFASRQAHALADHLGVDSSPIISLALPIGISFYTFHQISYVVDVGRRTRPAQRNLLTYVTYVAMFPQLVAGPIIRYHEIAEQLEHRQTRPLDDLAAGFPRFALGLVKKVVIADTIAPVADAAFALDGATMNSTAAWLAVVAYTLQIYFDFSAYSDMAIGLGRMLGLRLPENFARPYSASSMTDFWRRWHNVAVTLVSRLRVPAAGRQSRHVVPDVPQPLVGVRALRSVARGELDVPAVGRLSRWVAGGGADARRRCPGSPWRGVAPCAHAPAGDDRVGPVPRRLHR